MRPRLRRRACAERGLGAAGVREWARQGGMVGLYIAPIGTLRIVGDHFDCAVKHHDLRPVPGQACGPPDLVHSTKAAQHTASAKYAKSHHIPGRASEPCPPLQPRQLCYRRHDGLATRVHAQRSAPPTLTAVVRKRTLQCTRSREGARRRSTACPTAKFLPAWSVLMEGELSRKTTTLHSQSILHICA